MARRLYISASLNDRRRAKEAIQSAQKLGWKITWDWTREPPYDPDKVVGKAEVYLRAVYECDVFWLLANEWPSRGRERELGAALMLRQLGYYKRVLVSQAETVSDRFQGPTIWDAMCEVYRCDAEALKRLGRPKPKLAVPTDFLSALGTPKPRSRLVFLYGLYKALYPDQPEAQFELVRLIGETAIQVMDEA